MKLLHALNIATMCVFVFVAKQASAEVERIDLAGGGYMDVETEGNRVYHESPEVG